jgi:flagellar biosynthesis chaperone FliJ
LENQLAEQAGGKKEAGGALSNEVVNHQAQLQQLTSEKEQKGSQLETKEAQIVELSEFCFCFLVTLVKTNKISEQKATFLQDALARKEAEMAAKEEKYQRCIEKAKSVINTLDPKQDAEVAQLRNQIEEKERIIVNMEVICKFLMKLVNIIFITLAEGV